MHRRVDSLCTWWMVLLILLPFTAPFPTCDVSDFLTDAAHHHAPPLQSSTASLGDAAYSFVPPLATTEGRLKLVVVSRLASRLVVLPAPEIVAPSFCTSRVPAERRAIQPTNLRL